MAELREVPFRRYYGSVDSTPLFVMLAGAYLERTRDVATLQRLWPNIEAALSWLEKDGDRDGDGFIEYGRRSNEGLVNQGWKDSRNSVFHSDGALAKGPIALVEVQAYAYRRLARRRGDRSRCRPSGARPCVRQARTSAAHRVSMRRSSTRPRTPTCSRWTGKSVLVACAPPTQATRS